MELITVKHFWRLIQKAGFTTIKPEREMVTELVKNKLLCDIFEVKGLRKIMAQLGIVEDVPVNTKNFNYDNISGIGIRILNKIIRYMKEKKIKDVRDFIGHENIKTKQLVVGSKSEIIEVILAEDFLKVLRDTKIMKRWEDLDENLQIFLSLPSLNTAEIDEGSEDYLMMRKIIKCIQDFQNCELFKYYGYEPRTEDEVDSDDEPDDFNPFETMKNKLTTIK